MKQSKKVLIVIHQNDKINSVKIINTSMTDEQLKKRFSGENIKSIEIYRDFIEM